MKSEYVETFDTIRASEKAKQNVINILINHVSVAKINKTAKKDKRFTWSTKRITAAASAVAVLVFCAILLPALLIGPYSGGKEKSIKDYYEEYSFELPFEHTVGNNQYTTLYFDTGFTMEQMCESLNDAGYKANMNVNDNLKKLFIVAAKNGFSYYFVIYDKRYLEPIHGSKSLYTLSDCSASLNMPISNDVKEPHSYTFLFPNHLSGMWSGDTSVRIYYTFNEFAEFYKVTGKSDAQIDYENQTVTFFCEGNSSRSWIRGNVIMKYVESESGNYVNIQPQS